MTNELFESVYYPRYRKAIDKLAQKLAKRDADLRDDLVSAGMIALWRTDLSRIRENESALVRARLWGAMVDEVRRQKPERSVSLSQFLLDDQEPAQEAA